MNGSNIGSNPTLGAMIMFPVAPGKDRISEQQENETEGDGI